MIGAGEGIDKSGRKDAVWTGGGKLDDRCSFNRIGVQHILDRCHRIVAEIGEWRILALTVDGVLDQGRAVGFGLLVRKELRLFLHCRSFCCLRFTYSLSRYDVQTGRRQILRGLRKNIGQAADGERA